MAQPQQTFSQWAKTYNNRQQFQAQSKDVFKDGFLWKIVVLIGLGYLVWADKFSMTFSLNNDQLEGSGVKTSMLQIAPVITESLPQLKKAERTNTKPARQSMASEQKVLAKPLPDTEKTQRMKTYVERFAPVAIAEMKKFGIPASITLAQGLLESNAGASGLAKNANNHFGMKCFSKKCGKGHCVNYSDDTHKDFFIKFPNAWGSFRKHSELLKNNPRYSSLFLTKDYKKWAAGLTKAGYATDKGYGDKLVGIIESMGLQKYDR